MEDVAAILSLFYSWQALSLAVVASGIAELVKTSIDVALSGGRASWFPPPVDAKVAVRQARLEAQHKRKGKLWLNRVLLPLVPVFAGAGIACVVPIRPDFLVEAVTLGAHDPWENLAIYAIWGGVVGQFATYARDRIKQFMQTRAAGGAR